MAKVNTSGYTQKIMGKFDGLKSYERFWLQRIANTTRLGNYQDKPTNDRALMGVLNSEADLTLEWQKYAQQNLVETVDIKQLDALAKEAEETFVYEDKYYQTDGFDNIQDGAVAFTLYCGYYAGKLQQQSFDPNFTKAAKWLARGVLHNDNKALWVASNVFYKQNQSALYKACETSFKAIGLNTNESQLLVKAAIAGQADAQWILSQALNNPHGQQSQSLIEALRTLKPELFDGDKINETAAKTYAGQLVTEAALAGQADAQWILSQALNNPHGQQSQSLIEALRTLKPELFDGDKINETAAKTYAGQLVTEAALAGQADAQWILSQALNNPHGQQNQSLIEALRTLKPELFDGDKINETAAKTYAGQLVTEAALAGQADAQWILSQALNNPHGQQSQSLIEALRTLKPELFDGDKINETAAKTYAGQLVTEAALAGQADAQWILSQALNKLHDAQSQSLIEALRTLKPELFDGDKINETAAKTYAGQLVTEAALAGQADAQWILSQALNNPHGQQSQSRIEALRTLKPELFDGDKINETAAKTYAGQLKVQAALSGQADASNILMMATFVYAKDPNNPKWVDIVSALERIEAQSGVPILTNSQKREQLYNTFLSNVVAHDQQSTNSRHKDRLARLERFNQNGIMLKRQQNQLPEDDLNLIYATLKADDLGL